MAVGNSICCDIFLHDIRKTGSFSITFYMVISFKRSSNVPVKCHKRKLIIGDVGAF